MKDASVMYLLTTAWNAKRGKDIPSPSVAIKILFVVAISLASGHSIEIGPENNNLNQVSPYQLIKFVKIEIAESWDGSGSTFFSKDDSVNVVLPFFTIASKIMEYAGISSSPLEKNSRLRSTAILKISAHKRCLKGNYNQRENSGAVLYGDIQFISPDKVILEKKYMGRYEPPFVINSMGNYSQQAFQMAFCKKGSFAGTMLELTSEIYGNKVLLSAFNDHLRIEISYSSFERDDFGNERDRDSLDLRFRIMDLLFEKGPASTGILSDILKKDGDLGGQALAANTLGKLQVLEPLIEKLKGTCAIINDILYAIGRIKSKEAVNFLLDFYRTKHGYEARSVLLDMDRKYVATVLSDFLKDSSITTDPVKISEIKEFINEMK